MNHRNGSVRYWCKKPEQSLMLVWFNDVYMKVTFYELLQTSVAC